MATSRAPRTATAAPADAVVAGAVIRVRATRVGYHGEERKRVNDVFTLRPYTVTYPRTAMYDEVVVKDGVRSVTPVRHEQGETVTVTAEQQFSASWMEPVSARTPEHTTGAPAALNLEHEAILGRRRSHASGGVARDVNDEQGRIEDDPDPLN